MKLKKGPTNLFTLFISDSIYDFLSFNNDFILWLLFFWKKDRQETNWRKKEKGQADSDGDG